MHPSKVQANDTPSLSKRGWATKGRTAANMDLIKVLEATAEAANLV